VNEKGKKRKNGKLNIIGKIYTKGQEDSQTKCTRIKDWHHNREKVQLWGEGVIRLAQNFCCFKNSKL
jgi:hypothetical protein